MMPFILASFAMLDWFLSRSNSPKDRGTQARDSVRSDAPLRSQADRARPQQAESGESGRSKERDQLGGVHPRTHRRAMVFLWRKICRLHSPSGISFHCRLDMVVPSNSEPPRCSDVQNPVFMP